jgi:serine/threonine protein kinase
MPPSATASGKQQLNQQQQQPLVPLLPPAATRLATIIAPPPPPLPLVTPPPPPAPAAPTTPERAGSLGFSLDFDAAYDLGDLIGAGASGRVHHATERATGRQVAVKVLPKRTTTTTTMTTTTSSSSSSSSSSAEQPSPYPSPPPSPGRSPTTNTTNTTTTSRAAAIRREVGATALAARGSPYAPRLEGVFESDDEAFLVLERCEGGDLRSLLAARNGEPLTEAAAAAVLRGVLHALAACHARGMVFGDVKPSNVCLLRRRSSVEREGLQESSDDDTDARFFGGVRLVDWGAASPAPLSSRALAGSPLYWSPEQAEGYGGLMAAGPSSCGGGGGGGGGGEGGARGYGPEVDVWSAGVLLFQLLSGRLPYWGANNAPRRGLPGGADGGSSSGRASLEEGASAAVPANLKPYQLLAAIRTAPIGAWPGASAEARDLVSRMLERDPRRRITAAEALRHPFFAKHGGGGGLEAAGDDEDEDAPPAALPSAR